MDDAEYMAKALAGLPADAPQPVAKGWLQYLTDFASGGLHGALKGTPQALPEWVDPVAGAMQNPNFNAALGMGAGPRWTTETLGMLKDAFSKGPLTSYPRIPGHTQQAVAGKAAQLGLHLEPKAPWTASYRTLKPPDTSLPIHSPLFKARNAAEQPAAMAEALKALPKALVTPPPALEQSLTEYARGNLNAKGVQKIFKDHGWGVNLQRGKYDFEAWDPTGKMHYLVP